MKDNIKTFIKGIAIGIATIVPGVSGGTMALILGIYDNLISAVSSFFSDLKKNIIYLSIVGIGAVIGIVLFGQIVDFGLTHLKFPVTYLFLGIVIGGMPVLYKEASQNKIKITDYLYLIIGFIIVAAMTFYKGSFVDLSTAQGIWNVLFLILAGVIIAIALILPGISTSFLLLTLGLYSTTIDAIKTFNIGYLVPIGLGGLIGVVTTTKLLDRLMKNKPAQTYLLILGFVVGSIFEVFPGIPTGMDLILSIVTFILGYIIIRYVSKKYGD